MELKPCPMPWCRNPDVVYVPDDSYGGHGVSCNKCENGILDDKDVDVVKLWNHRPGEINAQEAVERVKAVLVKYGLIGRYDYNLDDEIAASMEGEPTP